jgi:hypothetical protein
MWASRREPAGDRRLGKLGGAPAAVRGEFGEMRSTSAEGNVTVAELQIVIERPSSALVMVIVWCGNSGLIAEAGSVLFF